MASWRGAVAQSVTSLKPVVILLPASVDELLEDRVAPFCNGDGAGDVFVPFCFYLYTYVVFKLIE